LVTDPPDAEKALVFDVTEGNFTIGEIGWGPVDGQIGKYRIDFYYRTDECMPGYKVNVTAVSAEITGSRKGEQQLDGGNWSQDGDAPNEHPFTWQFEY